MYDPPIIEPERRMVVLPDDSVVEAVVGYRSWKVRAEAGEVFLCSLHRPFCWPVGVVEKQWCVRCVPYIDGCYIHCGACGIYAWSRPMASVHFSDVVSGEVCLWGEVDFHHLGVRAEYAMPTALYTPPRGEGSYLGFLNGGPSLLLVEALALKYGVPVVGI